MNILVIGAGLMGPAAAFNAMSDAKVKRVTLADMNPEQLVAAQAKLAALPGGDKVHTVALNLADQEVAQKLMAGHDAIVAALPSAVIPLGITAAAAARVPWVDLSWPANEELPALQKRVADAGSLVIPGCGVEPGLTEIIARYLAEKLDRVDELHIKCGGIQAIPSGPLSYKIVFGGKRLPLREYPARVAENGGLREVPRYSGVENFVFDGVGEVEAWHEGFMPWLLELEALKELKSGTQKTVRWPGYAAKATALRELGLLSVQPVEVDGTAVAPKHVIDAVLYPHVKMEAEDRDLTILRVEAAGIRKGNLRRLRVDMLDRYDEELGFTSMARVTAYTGAIVARMAARGAIKATGWVTPEKVITGKLFDRLMDELAAVGVRFTLTDEKTKDLA